MQKTSNQLKGVKQVAVLGGSFDPPTISHLQVRIRNFEVLWSYQWSYRWHQRQSTYWTSMRYGWCHVVKDRTNPIFLTLVRDSKWPSWRWRNSSLPISQSKSTQLRWKMAPLFQPYTWWISWRRCMRARMSSRSSWDQTWSRGCTTGTMVSDWSTKWSASSSWGKASRMMMFLRTTTSQRTHRFWWMKKTVWLESSHQLKSASESRSAQSKEDHSSALLAWSCQQSCGTSNKTNCIRSRRRNQK